IPQWHAACVYQQIHAYHPATQSIGRDHLDGGVGCGRHHDLRESHTNEQGEREDVKMRERKSNLKHTERECRDQSQGTKGLDQAPGYRTSLRLLSDESFRHRQFLATRIDWL